MTTVLLYWNHICVLHKEKAIPSIDWLSACQTRTSTCESAISGLDTRNICRNIWPDRMPFSRI